MGGAGLQLAELSQPRQAPGGARYTNACQQASIPRTRERSAIPTAAPALDIETAARLRTAIGRLSRRLRTTAAGRAAGLTPTWSSVLLNVDRNGPVRLSELATAEGINPTMLSRAVGELVDKGLLERSHDPGDRRAAWVDATRRGRQLAGRMRRERTDALNGAMTALSRPEQRLIEEALPALEVLAEELKERRP